MVDEIDPLWEVKNAFYLGNFQNCINEGTSLSLPAAATKERDAFVFRSHIAQGNLQLVLDEIPDDASPTLLAIRILAKYLLFPEDQEAIKEEAHALTTSAITESDPLFPIIVATILMQEDNCADALRAVYGKSTLESSSLAVTTYLKMSRVDLAEKEIAMMQQKDDDHTLTQLANANVSIARGGSKIQEAFYIFQELVEKYGDTGLLLNGMAVCQLSMQKYPEAKKLLLQALEKNPRDPDTLSNLISCLLLEDASQDMVNRYVSQLKTAAPGHPRVRELNSMRDSFTQLAERYGPR